MRAHAAGARAEVRRAGHPVVTVGVVVATPRNLRVRAHPAGDGTAVFRTEVVVVALGVLQTTLRLGRVLAFSARDGTGRVVARVLGETVRVLKTTGIAYDRARADHGDVGQHRRQVAGARQIDLHLDEATFDVGDRGAAGDRGVAGRPEGRKIVGRAHVRTQCKGRFTTHPCEHVEVVLRGVANDQYASRAHCRQRMRNDEASCPVTALQRDAFISGQRL